MIHLEGITKSFGSLQVLKGIDLEITQGEVVSIVGPSGAGKTTLLQIMGTLDSPDAGMINIDGTNVSRMKEKELSAFRNKHIGFVFQFHQLLPEFTALENVMIPAFIAGVPTKEASMRAMEILDFMGLKERASHKPNELSGGEKQRVAVARALINQPAVILADEPSGSLDSHNKEELHQLFFDLRNRFGQTFVIVTHDEALAKITDRTIHMVDGNIIKECENKLRRHILNTKEIKLRGRHNFENICSALAATKEFVSEDTAVEAIKEFNAVEHRLEFVRNINGVKWYNDSASSSPSRTIAGLNAYDEEIVLIAGGYDKNLDYEILGKYIVKKVKALILIGNTAKKILTATMQEMEKEKIEIPICCAKTLEEAVEAAKADLIAGKTHVYDITTFTVDGKTLDSYEADIDTDPDYTPDHEVVSDGYFHESDVAFRSAPYFNVRIDGINLLDEQY